MPNRSRTHARRGMYARVGAAALLLFVIGCSRLSLTRPPEVPVSEAVVDLTAFVGVAVIPMVGDTILERQTVIVRNGRIEQIGPTAETPVPVGATLISGTGKYLVPGFAEMHAHIPPPLAGKEEIETTLFLYLSAGVTAIRGMLGHPAHLRLRDHADEDGILAPRIYTSGPSLNGQSAPDPATARRMVEAQVAAGYDLLKLHPGLSREVFDTVAVLASRLRIPFGGHVSTDVGVARTIDARQSTIDHLDGYLDYLATGDEPDGMPPGFFGFNYIDRIDEERYALIVERTRAAGVANVPTQTLAVSFAGTETPAQLAARPEMRFMPRSTVAEWSGAIEGFRNSADFSAERGQRFIEARNRLIRELNDAGAPILLGSDAPQIFNVPGFSAIREMILLVDAGLSPYDALRASTVAPAAHLGARAEWGTIQPGRAADLILLDANPLIDIRNVERRAGVMVRGLWLSDTNIHERLERIARRYAG